MNTQAIYYRKSLSVTLESRLKNVWLAIDKLKRWQFEVRMLTFSAAIVSGSIGCAFAAFMKNDFLLAIIIFLSTLTLAFCIQADDVKLILLSGILTVIISVITIVWGITASGYS